MTTLVTGGAGFIGAEVVATLLAQGVDDVHVTTHSGNLRRLGDAVDQVTMHDLDLADGSQISAVVEAVRPRVIYHLGAMLSGPSEADPQTSVQTNAFGTYALLEAARACGTEQFLFASSIGVFIGADLPDGPITDATLQRPDLVYGVTKVFGELLGRFYRRKYGLDFRGLRYPGIVGPGVTTWSLAQCTSWIIETPARGEPFTCWLAPETPFDLVYYKEAGAALVQLADAPHDSIKTVNYNLGGMKPTVTMGQLADAVHSRIPNAKIEFQVDPTIQAVMSNVHPLDDSRARQEWGWTPHFDYQAMVDDFLAELRDRPERYR